MPDFHRATFLLPLVLLVLSVEIQTKDVPAAVAFKCGKPSLYLTPVGWMLDEEQPCLHRDEDILAYCRRVYNDSSFSRVAFTTVIEVTLPNWCHANLSDCPPSVENRTTYLIQPWICSGAPPPRLTVPVNCSLKRIDDPHHESYSCHKAAYWLQAAQTACQSSHAILADSMPIKPCIKADSYSTMHYLGVDIVCCSNLTDNDNSNINSVGLSSALLGGSADTTLIISKDERIYNNYLAADTNRTAENKTYENQQFKLAKAAEKEAYALRKGILEDELSSAEKRLSAADWLHHPEQTQETEDALQKEFFQKYMALSEEDREMQRRLDTVHWKREMRGMEHRKQAVLDQWNNLMEQSDANLTVIEHAAGRLLHTLEKQRARVIRRFEHARSTNPSEARRILPEVRQHLSDLDHLLSNSLAKLDKVPAYKDAVLEHVLRLREAHYAQTDASAKEIAVMSSVSLSDSVQLPTPSDEAALRAAKLISQHEHHLLGKNSPSDGVRKPVDAQRSPIHQPEHVATIVPSLAMPHHLSEATRTVENNGQPHAVVVSYPKSPDPQPADSTEDIVVEIHLPTPQPNSEQTIVTNTASPAAPEAASPKQNKAQIVVPAIFACLVFLLVVILIARCYVRRMRLQRAGYNLTVVEVDEVANTEATNRGPHLPRLGRGRLTAGGVGTGSSTVGTAGMVNDHDPVDPLARWQVNGYENPAYKFTEGGYAFSPAD